MSRSNAESVRGLPMSTLYAASPIDAGRSRLSQARYNRAMNDDDNVCLCFKVSKRKIVSYCQREKPPVASLISECLSAGTGWNGSIATRPGAC